MAEKRPPHEELTIMEAVDNLSSMAEVDLAITEEVAPQDFLETEMETERMGVKWLNPDQQEKNREIIKQTFKTIHHYLENLYEKDYEQLKDIETQKGIQAIMVLAGEAADKVDKFTSLFKGAHVKELKEFKELQQFYLSKIMKKVQAELEKEEAWQAEWGNLEEGALDVERRGLKDLETVRRDQEYELFYIHREDGKPYFNRNLLRHIRLIGNFDEFYVESDLEDPFLRLRIIQDKILHHTAQQILQRLAPIIDDFYKEAMRHKEEQLVGCLNKAVMALMLSSNSRNLLQNTTGKSSFSYFLDFQNYLREGMRTKKYQELIEFPPDQSEHFDHILLTLTHNFCSSVFTNIPYKKEALEFLHRLFQKGALGKATHPLSTSGISFWNSLLDEDEKMRHLLKNYPNGPLLKTLDAFREGEEKLGFDPFTQENIPSQLFTFSNNELHVTTLRVPSPTHQEWINKAEVVAEFKGFLRSLNLMDEKKKHLLINLQDRTSWQEHARCIALEELQKDAEFISHLVVLTLPKNTDFYLQTASYHHLNQAEEFIAQLKDQIASAEACGFFFPPQLSIQKINEFTEKILPIIHRNIFSSKNVLSRKNRLDFIEVFYHFLMVQIILWIKPDSLSFTCKDSIDVGEVASGAFYAFLRMMNSLSPWTDEEKDFLRWVFYFPALVNRERSVHLPVLTRVISVLALLQSELEGQRKAILEDLQELYGQKFFETLSVKISVNEA